jgi:hypothetical protein
MHGDNFVLQPVDLKIQSNRGAYQSYPRGGWILKNRQISSFRAGLDISRKHTERPLLIGFDIL